MRNILIIRSGPMGQFYSVLERVRTKYTHADIYVCTHVSSADELRDLNAIRLYTYTTRTFSPLSFSIAEWKHIRKRSFDLLIVLTDNEFGVGYINIMLALLFFKTAIIQLWPRSRTPIETTEFQFFLHSAIEAVKLVGYSVIWGALCATKFIRRGCAYRN